MDVAGSFSYGALMELADSPGWLSCPVRSLHFIGPRPPTAALIHPEPSVLGGPERYQGVA
jgi:hypothetical protein